MSLAPIILFCYNRPRVLRKAIECLQKNTLARESDLFIYSDGSKSDEDKKKVDEVRALIRDTTGFKRITIIESENNKGLANSVIAGVSDVIRQSGRVIVLEDDLVTSPCFLEYMNKALDCYRDNKRVFCINGMGYLNPQQFPSDYKEDFYFIPRNSSHGWATWCDRWDKMVWENDYFREELKKRSNRIQFSRGGGDLCRMLRRQISGKINSWSVRWSYIITKNNGLALAPKFSYTSHLDDERGTHIGKNSTMLIHDTDLALPVNENSFLQSAVVDKRVAKRFVGLYSIKGRILKRLVRWL